jgi:hypothetical protein
MQFDAGFPASVAAAGTTMVKNDGTGPQHSAPIPWIGNPGGVAGLEKYYALTSAFDWLNR